LFLFFYHESTKALKATKLFFVVFVLGSDSVRHLQGLCISKDYTTIPKSLLIHNPCRCPPTPNP